MGSGKERFFEVVWLGVFCFDGFFCFCFFLGLKVRWVSFGSVKVNMRE